jgi:mannose-6-phosphate isomerase-like protein (cupin superfamily)
MTIRRVVTGHDDSGRAVFAGDDEVDGLELDLLPGWQFYDIWAADQTRHFPDDGAKPAVSTYFPAVEGVRFAFSVVPPQGTPPVEGIDEVAARADVDAALPELMDYLEDDGFHTTDTIDFEVIIRGDVYLQLDDGAEKLLHPGDTVVQNGTRHLWRNPGPEPCLMAVFMVGAHREPSGKQTV